MEKVESHRSEERIGTTYRLYSYGVILDRRRRAGLEWITRNRGGVVFVPGPQSSRGTVSPHQPQIGDTVPSQATLSVPSEDRGTVASEDTPLDNKIVNARLAAVPAYFSPPRTELVRYRKARAATELKNREARDALIAEMRKTLENPDATASDQAMARQWLETS